MPALWSPDHVSFHVENVLLPLFTYTLSIGLQVLQVFLRDQFHSVTWNVMCVCLVASAKVKEIITDASLQTKPLAAVCLRKHPFKAVMMWFSLICILWLFGPLSICSSSLFSMQTVRAVICCRPRSSLSGAVVLFDSRTSRSAVIHLTSHFPAWLVLTQSKSFSVIYCMCGWCSLHSVLHRCRSALSGSVCLRWPSGLFPCDCSSLKVMLCYKCFFKCLKEKEKEGEGEQRKRK